MEKAKCVIIGSGPAGYTAAIYVARANLQPVLYQGPQPGGQLMITPTIENYPGFTEGIDPFTLLNAMCEQAKKYGADIREGIVKEVKFEKNNNLITIDDGSQITAQCVIIATGASAKFLGLPSEKQFMGKGVSACATCDGFFFRGKTVAVVGNEMITISHGEEFATAIIGFVIAAVLLAVTPVAERGIKKWTT